MSPSLFRAALAPFAMLLGLSVYGGDKAVSTRTPAPPTPTPTNATKIKHIVIIMQQNRSFNSYISRQTHEFSGYLRYTEAIFGLPPLGTRDVGADDFADRFDYPQTVQTIRSDLPSITRRSSSRP